MEVTIIYFMTVVNFNDDTFSFRVTLVMFIKLAQILFYLFRVSAEVDQSIFLHIRFP